MSRTWILKGKGLKFRSPQELLDTMDGKNKCYPDNTLGLLRFIRNLHQHYPKEAAEMDPLMLFPNLLDITTTVAPTPKNCEEDPPLSVQESPRIATLPTAKDGYAECI
ncbi:hypothetical protein CgunFtcFv8_006477 [Champsocephalus gunnari]|uniref:Uncharacterized protein n=1 Tax=Champsocephalus gunnari TaxID=52237 RepID=A0AAN8BYC1_CHAGU|nr:hypothetical protein CgunFtcFv8_006477 [Champsocephalus gunnari]